MAFWKIGLLLGGQNIIISIIYMCAYVKETHSLIELVSDAKRQETESTIFQ